MSLGYGKTVGPRTALMELRALQAHILNLKIEIGI